MSTTPTADAEAKAEAKAEANAEANAEGNAEAKAEATAAGRANADSASDRWRQYGARAAWGGEESGIGASGFE